MTNKIPSGMEKHHKCTEPESSKTAKMFLLLLSFFLFSSDRLAQYCMNFSQWFMYETAAFFPEQCTTLRSLLWMDEKASPPCLKTRITHTSRNSKNMNNTSLIHSDTCLWQGPNSVFSSASFDWQHDAYTGSSIPCPGTHTDCISNSVILRNNFMSLLSDL